MKKHKRLLALFLALALSAAALAMPVAAADFGEASTYGVVRPTICPRCGGTASLAGYQEPTIFVEDRTCSENRGMHAHAIVRGYSYYECLNCGNFYDRIEQDLGCVKLEPGKPST